MRNSITCRRCFAFLAFGAEGGHSPTIEWIEACDWCLAHDAKEREAEAEVEALEELWRARECAADGCAVVFTPGAVQQRFCSDSCRRRSYRRAKVQGRR